LNLSLDRVNSARNFTNKLWNAGKFILFQLEGVSQTEWDELCTADLSAGGQQWAGLGLSERWVLSSLHQVRWRQAVAGWLAGWLASWLMMCLRLCPLSLCNSAIANHVCDSLAPCLPLPTPPPPAAAVACSWLNK
jgi:hypothetical protein